MDIRKELKNTIYNAQRRLDNVAGVDSECCRVRADELEKSLLDLNRILAILETPELPTEKPKTQAELESEDLKMRAKWRGNMD